MSIKKILKPFLAIIILSAVFFTGFYFGSYQISSSNYQSEDIDFSLFWQAYYRLKNKFVDKEKLDNEKMLYGAISGMVESLEDPYTVFLTPEETKIFIEDVAGVFEGVGMEVGIRDKQLQVIAPLEGTPAQRAGLRAGDKILAIDGKSTFDMATDEAVSLIRGPKGTEVTLTILRNEWLEAKDFKITRDTIEVPSLRWEILDNNIAYLKIYEFSEKANSDFKIAANQILNSSAEKIILDLRDNPGGYLEVSQDIAGWFLEKGNVVVIEDFGEKNKQEIYKAKGPSQFLDYPVVILINQGSASASEILAGALRDNRQIMLIGEKSFGKGSVQELDNLSKGSLKITVARWLTPKGESISDKGLEPDIKVEMTEEDYAAGKDPQLDKAIEIIKEIK